MKIESLKKDELISYCKSLNIVTQRKTKDELKKAIYLYRRNLIDEAITLGNDVALLKSEIQKIADEYASNLNQKIKSRRAEMKLDDTSHYMIYRVLGISFDDGALIDEYQNTGRFLYKYAGSFLEEVASLCLFFSNSLGMKTIIENGKNKKPKTFEIDFLNGKDAIELKWRDATTDGDHIMKEHTRVKVIRSHGYTPVRVMFYVPQRKIQETLKTLYDGIGGEYYSDIDAWNYLQKVSGYDLKSILEEIAESRDDV